MTLVKQYDNEEYYRKIYNNTLGKCKAKLVA